jgi:hypothetical protein
MGLARRSLLRCRRPDLPPIAAHSRVHIRLPHSAAKRSGSGFDPVVSLSASLQVALTERLTQTCTSAT